MNLQSRGCRCAAIVIAWLVFSAFANGTHGEKPNIVLIMTDDAAYSNFGFSSALTNTPTHNQTPNIDALAQQSVIASQAYVAHSLCSPTRAGLLTGLHQQRFGYEDNVANNINSTQGLSADQITIAQRLKPLGYTTGIVGKWHMGYVDGYNRPLDKGFDEFYGLLGGGREYWTDPATWHAIFKNNQYYENEYRQEGDQSRYDPVRGRYLTDALGEEAASFINRHAQDENPFFLYVPLTGPHEPYQAKQSDLDLFADVTNPTRRAIAAMTYAVDRAVGDVLGALEANKVDDNTIVILTNDNGAVSTILNPPFRGWKGTTYEGGIRVPFLIKAPGLEPGAYDDPVSFFDVVPTLVTAAGGDTSQFAHDGIDMMPFLKGEATQDSERKMFWRSQDIWAVRKGDWKLLSPTIGFAGRFLHNIAEDPDENDFSQFYQHPEIVADLSREFTYWEAEMAKPKWGFLGAEVFNTFDHFVFRADQGSANWDTASAWRQTGTTNNVNLQPSDAYPNAILEFGVRSDGDYIATNNMTRWSKFTFMLNEMRLTGEFAGDDDHFGTINGNKVLFVKSLSGELPEIRLDATSASAAEFAFQIDLEMQLLHDLEITGNGTQDFVISGAIRDYYEPQAPTVTTPHSVRKLGSSAVTLRGNNTFAGSLSVEQGQVTVDGPTAAINGAAGIDVGSEGTFRLQSGNVTVEWIDNDNGGTFQFVGGTLKVKQFSGNLTNSGGVFSPGASPAASVISGNFQQHSGTTVIEIGGTAAGTQYDSLVVGGSALVVGTLDVDLLNGYVPGVGNAFQVLTAMGGVSGVFTETLLPALPAGRFWNVLQGANSVILAVAPTAALTFIPGDFNLDGTVDAADYTVWRDHLGTSFAGADANFDGQVTTADYALWKSHFGFSLVGSGFAAQAMQSIVPEPTAMMLLLVGFIGVAFSRRRQ